MYDTILQNANLLLISNITKSKFQMKSKVNKIHLFLTLILSTLAVCSLGAQNAGGGHQLRTVVIDPGHGGKDPGAIGPDSRHHEKHIVLNIAKELGSRIRSEYPDVKVVYTRSGDTFPKLIDRVRITKNANADLFISIHCNSSKKKTASGSSAHILSRKDSKNPHRDLFEENKELTDLENSVIEFEEDQSSYKDTAEEQIFNSLLFHANFEHSILFAQLVVENLCDKPFHKWNKGLHQNDFLLLKKITCPAILVETAFLSNPEERKLLVSEKWQKEIADRLFEAFREYKKLYDASVQSAPAPEPSTPARQTKPAETSKPTVEQPAQKPSAEPFQKPVSKDNYYAIQVMGLCRLLKTGDPAFKGLDIKSVKGENFNTYKYIYGQYDSYEEASANIPAVRRKFPEAFIVRIENGKVVKNR